MRRALVAFVAAVVLGAGLAFVAAAVYEVTGLGGRLAGTIRELREPPRLGLPPPLRRPPGPEPPGARAAPLGEARVRFTLTEVDLDRLLRRSGSWLGGAFLHTREVRARLADGHVLLATRNRFQLLGVPVADYSGLTDWRLAARPEGLGVQLLTLRVAGVPAPFAAGLLKAVSEQTDGDWVIVPMGSRRALESIEVGGGRLSVAVTLR